MEQINSFSNINSESTLLVLSSVNSNDMQFDKSDRSKLTTEELSSQLSSTEVINLLIESKLDQEFLRYENEINKEGINSELKLHSPRHIKNVLLYSTIIAGSIFKDINDIKLIMLSAKYHDSGRTRDSYEEHAKPGAIVAENALQNICTPNEIAIIKTLIEFHEVSRDSQSQDDIFERMIIENNVKTDDVSKIREMAEVLKDADALDRTRFINVDSRLNPKYLTFDISKRLIKLATEIQEKYALLDLSVYDRDDAINILLNDFTPQEIIRILRHINLNSDSLESIQQFINDWAYPSNKQTKNFKQ